MLWDQVHCLICENVCRIYTKVLPWNAHVPPEVISPSFLMVKVKGRSIVWKRGSRVFGNKDDPVLGNLLLVENSLGQCDHNNPHGQSSIRHEMQSLSLSVCKSHDDFPNAICPPSWTCNPVHSNILASIWTLWARQRKQLRARHCSEDLSGYVFLSKYRFIKCKI